MGSEILINVRPNQTRVAYVENGELSDLKVERQKAPTSVGSVFKGKVMRVLPGMQAAFVDIGLARAAFLYVGDIRGDIDSEKLLAEEEAHEVSEEDFETGNLLDSPITETVQPMPLIQDLLKEGQMILVQVAKDPLGTKGARITTHISLPGRLLVFMPTLTHLGISRRIVSEQERERLRATVESLNPRGGVIVRTAGEGAELNSIKQDLEYLNRTWKEIQRNYEKRKTPGLIYSELDVELRALRDLLTEDIESVIIDDQLVYKRVVNFVTHFMPKFKNKVKRYRDPQPLFDLYDLDLEISRSLGRTVWLKSGGYIVIDEAEALVVIDVNTGRFVGKKDLEDTILKTNLEAAKEIAHQLRIRNCGGIIIIDFIDMEKALHREKVLSALKEELNKDRARTEVTAMSELGLVEMTRKRIRPSLVSTLCENCPYCDGKGYIKQKTTIASELFREIEREAIRMTQSLRFVVTCHGDLADWIYAEETSALENLEKKLGCSVTFKVEASYHIEQFAIETEL